MSGDEVYEKKLLDRVADAIVDSLAALMNVLRPGWRERNRARLDELKLTLYALNRSPIGLLGVALVVIFIMIAIIGPFIAPLGYNDQLVYCVTDFDAVRLAPPGTVVEVPEDSICTQLGIEPGTYKLWLGADEYGRDLLSRILYGARTSFIVVILVMAIGPWIGILLGLFSGYKGGVVDEIIMRVVDVFLAFPGLILAIALSAVLPSRLDPIIMNNELLLGTLLRLFALNPEDALPMVRLVVVVIALWIVWWPVYARLVRGMVLSARENTYVEAARALGIPTHSILVGHILPNILGPVLVYLTLDFGAVILVEAGLSFLGLGAVPPIADWGRIIYDGAQYYPNAWWLVFFPGLAILFTVLGFNLLGDALRDIMDPRTRRRIEFKVKGR
ncbi:ABC transporter permease [Aeropyrum camini]|uniref:ABC transporter permease n=1 Tax=Aeropyrum camini SY1 = JCM 12091 TaxID=1198449 RepID=U3TG96_9CREN|nr:ABC transporter permease [Aeropyrum camini]BAN90349.1 ABC transporter permease [Aeropyrum camini SY1 = JCM 12091]